jgi:SPP1 gp7 family putative phage head morphogenesis protein
MDELLYREALQAELAKKFKGKTAIKSMVVPRFPHAVEREYLRVVQDYMSKSDAVIRKHMPALKAALERTQPIQTDAAGESPEDLKSPDEVLDLVQQELGNRLQSYDMRKRLERTANMNRKLTVAEWKRVCQRTLGIDIFEDYYNGDFFKSKINEWVTENVDLITTQSKDTLDRMREIVKESRAAGRRVESIAKDINAAYGMGKRHAMLIARDQTAKLNASIAEKQQADAGVRMYVWDTSGDQRVRESHRKMQGLYCKYDDVTVCSTTGKEGSWKKKTPDMPNIKGVFVHPGKDYQCRCIAMPVFNMEGVTEIPVQAVDWDKVDKQDTEIIAIGKVLKANGATVWEVRKVLAAPGVNRHNAGQILAQQRQAALEKKERKGGKK